MVKFPKTHSWFGDRYSLVTGNITKSRAYNEASLLRGSSPRRRARVLIVDLPNKRKTYGVYDRYANPKIARRKK